MWILPSGRLQSIKRSKPFCIGIANGLTASCHTNRSRLMPALFQFMIILSAYRSTSCYPNCAACYHGTYINTPNTCDVCHIADYNKVKIQITINQLGLSHDCATCHTTQAGWEPAAMPNHDTYYPLTGAHQSIASDCAACHHGDYNNTPNTCSGCHTKTTIIHD